MGNLNQQIIKDAITTGSLSSGILKPYQAKKFIQQTFDATNLGQLVRHEMRRERTGEIDKIGIAKRILRKKVENEDDGFRQGVDTSQIEYACTSVRLPWEITEETLRENIEGEQYEAVVTNLMTSQLGVDAEDLYLNGNTDAGSATAFDSGTPYEAGKIVTYNGALYEFITSHETGEWNADEVREIGDAGDTDFLKVNDGWIKQLKKGAHVEDRSSKSSGAMSIDVYYDALQQLPNKYNNGKLTWLMSPHRKQEWDRYLLNQIISQGGAVPDSVYKSPASIPVVEVPSLSDDNIILTDPKNLIVVNSYSMKIRKTTEGKEAVMQDKRFYVVHFDFDPIIEELDAACIITGLK